MHATSHTCAGLDDSKLLTILLRSRAKAYDLLKLYEMPPCCTLMLQSKAWLPSDWPWLDFEESQEARRKSNSDSRGRTSGMGTTRPSSLSLAPGGVRRLSARASKAFERRLRDTADVEAEDPLVL